MLAIARVGHLRIEAPALLAGFGVERDDEVVRCAEVERVVDLQRRDFVGGLVGVGGPAQVTGVVMPDRFEPLDVLRRDLRQRRIALAQLGATIGLPIPVGHLALPVCRRLGQRWRQHALEVVRVAPDCQDRGHAPEHDRQQQRQRRATPGTPTEVLPAQALHDPGHQQPKAERRDEAAARRQLPPVQADLVKRPTERREHQQRIQPERGASTLEQQDAHQQEPRPDGGEIPGATEIQHPYPAGDEHQPEKNAEHTADDDGHRCLLSSGLRNRPPPRRPLVSGPTSGAIAP